MNPFKPFSPRLALGLVFAVAVAAMASGYYVQHVIGLEPCPLCIVQRLGFVGSGLLAGLGALLGARADVAIAFALLADLAAVAGTGVAFWHARLIASPPEWAQCGRPFAWMLENNSLVTLIPKLFKGEGDCLTVGWTLLGLNIPQWSVILFVLMASLCTYAAAVAVRKGSAAH